MELAPEEIDNPHQERQDDADNYASHDWKIKAAVASLYDDISREATQPERQFGPKHHQRAQANHDNANDEQEFAEFAN
jgi:hypothetical protein